MTAPEAQFPFKLDAVVPFLLKNGLISADDVVSKAVLVQSEPRRNRNFRVELAGRGYFLKHPERLSPGSFLSTVTEALFLQQAARTSVGSILPRLVLRDDKASVTILELLPAHRTLLAYFASFVYPEFPISICGDVGKALASIHSNFTAWGRESDFVENLSAAPPWVAQIHKPPLWMQGSLTPGAEEVLQIVQRSEVMCASLDGFEDVWLPGSMIHGDIKADNILVEIHGGYCADLRIIDWEMVQRGDPAWDAAGFVQDLVMAWLRQFRPVDDDVLDMTLLNAKLPISVIQRAIQRFWWSYIEHAEVPNEGWSAFSARLAHFVGIRIIQTVYEAMMNHSAITAPVVLALQVSENILADSGKAARSFLGIVGKQER